MDKIWYLFIEGKEEGPYSFNDLKKDWRLTPDTLVWRKGFEDWIPIRDVRELKDLFKDEEPLENQADEIKFKKIKEGEALTLETPWLTPPFLILFLILLLSLLIFYHLFGP